MSTARPDVRTLALLLAVTALCAACDRPSGRTTGQATGLYTSGAAGVTVAE